MAIKIRCVDCKKKISIDEAFAGGVCRCPYCTAIVYVPDDAGQKKGKKGKKELPQTPKRRPTAPGVRPLAPAAPQEITKVQTPVQADAMADTAIDAPAPVDTLAETAIDAPAPAKKIKPLKTATQVEADRALAARHGQRDIPTAAPVKFQGIVAIILLVLMVGMVGGMIYLGIQITNPTVVDDTPEGYDNTAVTVREFPAVAGTIKVTAPVVYLIDTSRPMGEVFEAAGNIVIASAKSLKGGKFNVILLGEDEDKALSPQPITSDPAGIAKAKTFIALELCGAAEQARGMQAALDMKAKTVVLLARDSAMGAKDLAQGAFKEKAVKLHTIVLGRTSRGLAQMAEVTGGETKKFTTSELAEQAKRAAGQ